MIRARRSAREHIEAVDLDEGKAILLGNVTPADARAVTETDRTINADRNQLQ